MAKQTEKKREDAQTQACVGCGFLAPEHPYVAVMQPEDVPEGVTPLGEPSARGFVATPCCQECWQNAQHRVRPIKGHFFPAGHAVSAVFHAGSNNIGGDRG